MTTRPASDFIPWPIENVDAGAETAPIIGRYHPTEYGAAPVNLSPLGVGTRAAPPSTYPATSSLSEALLWRGYGLDDDL